jgi:hypothetical protein
MTLQKLFSVLIFFNTILLSFRPVTTFHKSILFPARPSCFKLLLLFPFVVAPRPNAGHGLLILEVSRSHTTTFHSR